MAQLLQFLVLTVSRLDGPRMHEVPRAGRWWQPRELALRPGKVTPPHHTTQHTRPWRLARAPGQCAQRRRDQRPVGPRVQAQGPRLT